MDGQHENASAAIGARGAPADDAVTLVRGAHRWRFACDPGDEPVLVRALTMLATSDEIPFDWFDAALVSHQLGSKLGTGFAGHDAGGD